MPHLSRTFKIIGAFAAVAVLSGGIAVAAAPSLRSEPTNPPTPAINAANVVTQTGYVPLAPCRIVDTRAAGGPISGSATRTFRVGGTTGFLGQGGKSGGCGVPIGASSVALDVTTTRSARGNGFLALFADGTSRPEANQTSYLDGQNITTLVNAPVSTTTGGVSVYASRTTQVLIDVAGYYREPVAGYVSASGSLGAHSGQVLSSSGTGDANGYTVTLDGSYTGCALNTVAQFSDGNAAGQLNGSSLRIFTRNVTATNSPYAPYGFYFTITC